MANFLFGQPVLPAKPTADSARRLFVLGAYPSALHVRWSYNGKELIKAVAIDNEPEPFWTGKDQEDRIKAWKERMNWDGSLGTVEACSNLNGPSGAWVEKEVFEPLGVPRQDAWITDCIDTYFSSDGASDAIKRTREMNLFSHEFKWPSLCSHPSEKYIVENAQITRLLQELLIAQPQLIITLGNAALKVCRDQLVHPIDTVPDTLGLENYGIRYRVKLKGTSGKDHLAELLPLAHPAAPRVYQVAHAAWIKKVTQ